MIKKDISPEERLLSLIKNKNKKEAVAAEQQAPKEESAETVMSKAEERISGMLKSELFKNKLFEPSTLKNVNRYLVILLALLLLYFIADLILARPYKNVQSLIVTANAPAQNEKKPAPELKDITVVKDYSSYSGPSSGKTVFGQSQGAPEDVEPGDATAAIGLVGIIAGDNPQAIIEDKKAQKTYYLNKGQSFNGYVVEEISENKVILDCEGKKISLFL